LWYFKTAGKRDYLLKIPSKLDVYYVNFTKINWTSKKILMKIKIKEENMTKYFSSFSVRE
jgi:hypothetical protein